VSSGPWIGARREKGGKVIRRIAFTPVFFLEERESIFGHLVPTAYAPGFTHAAPLALKISTAYH